MDTGDLAQIAAVVGAPGAALALMARGRVALLAGLGLLAAAEVLFALSVDAGSSVTATLGLAAGAVVVIGVGAYGFVRWPALVPPFVLAAAPFRVPLDFGSEHPLFVSIAEQGDLGRLVPLYVVLGAAVLALAYRTLKGEVSIPMPRAIAIPAGAFVAYASLSLLWATDLEAGRDALAFFLLPFSALTAAVARAPFASWLPKALAWISVTLAGLFVLVGLIEAATRSLLFSAPTVDIGNTYSSLFRVTSLFRDPNLYGRHVVLGLVVLVTVLLFARVSIKASLLVAFLFAGLYFTYSQTSMAALFVAVLALTLVAARGRLRLTIAAIACALVVTAGALAGAQGWDESLRRVTSGRSFRAAEAAQVAADHPIVGVGIGSQPLASQRLSDRSAVVSRFVSHTTPVTVVAELGVVGLLLYLALLGGAGRTIAVVHSRDRVFGLALAAALLALFVHSLAYSGFFEDPITWLVFGLAAGASVRPTQPAPDASARSGIPVPVGTR
jgi:hypothetical protein